MSIDVRPVFDDLHLWDDADESPLEADIPVWIACGVTGSDTWTIALSHQCEYRIHGGAIMIIIFFDLWFNANRHSAPTIKRNRLCHYLQHLQGTLMRELESAASLQLLDTTWQPWCLRQWAVRVKHGFHHSPQGREEYNEYCIQNGWKLYQHDDPLQYSEFCL